MKRTSNEKGFTLVELLVVIIITTMFSTLILFFTINYWRYGYLLEADQVTFVSRLNAGDYIRDNLNSSSGLITQNSIADSNTLSPDPAIGSGLYWAPVHAIPTTIPVGTSGITPLLYFRRPSINTTGAIIMNGTQPYEDEIVFYLNGATKQMLSRILSNPAAPGNRLKTSCPAVSATSACPADRIIIKDLSSVEMRYFSRTANTINYMSITDAITGEYIGPDFPVVEVVEFTLNITKKPIFQKTNATTNSTVIRVALRNS